MLAAQAVLLVGTLLLVPKARNLPVGRSLQRPSCSPVCCDIGFEVNVQVTLEDGPSELITLTSSSDAALIAAELSRSHDLSPEQTAALEMDLAAQWADGRANVEEPPVYVGPMCDENALQNCVASVELSSTGLVLEVADSIVADGGRGLFLRIADERDAVTIREGTAVCGYAAGGFRALPDSEGGKSVAFALASAETAVWFEQQLWSVGELLSDPDEGVEQIAGHTPLYDEEGALCGFTLEKDYEARYFVPDAEQPPLSTATLGQMANDMAYGGAMAAELADITAELGAGEAEGATQDGGSEAERYEEASAILNLLVLVMRLERDPERPSLLLPSRPISTLSRSITFMNDVPMELGCQYGMRYWSNKREADAAA